jgi:hypothetical protein
LSGCGHSRHFAIVQQFGRFRSKRGHKTSVRHGATEGKA